jgi:NADPH-dependent 2,4-dienoyl-CoA reductase/sulfur reductase-like enzyme
MVHTLRTLEDAEAIRDRAGSGGVRDVVALGAGLVSLQTADAIHGEGMSITFLVGSGQVLSQNVDKECAGIIEKCLGDAKAVIHFGNDAQAIEQKKNKAVVISRSGERFPADMVIVGKGVEPNARLARDSGIAVNSGVLVDEYTRTNIPNVYAAGDVAEGPALLSGRPEVVATWYNACHQGRIAGMNMAGKNETFAGGLNRNITTLFGTTVASVGAVKGLKEGGAEEVIIDRPADGVYRKLLLRDDVIEGAVLMGRISDSGMAESLIQNRVKIPPRPEIPQRHFMNLRGIYYSSVNATA